MKKFTTVALAGAIALGGLGVSQVVQPVTKAHAATLDTYHAEYVNFDGFSNPSVGETIHANSHILNQSGAVVTTGAQTRLVVKTTGNVIKATGATYVSNANGYAYPSIVIPNVPTNVWYKLVEQVYQPSTATWTDLANGSEDILIMP